MIHSDSNHYRLVFVLLPSLWLGACQALGDPDGYDLQASPDERLAGLMTELEASDPSAPMEDDAERARRHARHMQARDGLRALSFEHPEHIASAMAVGALEYDEGDPIESARVLDRLLQQHPVHTDATLLRARIAMEANNLPLAMRLCEELILHRPDLADAREAMAAVLFLTGEYAGADRQLDAAESLGSPEWRIAYHRGLIAEHDGRTEDARGYYARAYELEPGSELVRSRLLGLGLPLGSDR